MIKGIAHVPASADIEAPRRRAGGESSTVRTFDQSRIRSLTPPQAAGNALAVAVQKTSQEKLKKACQDFESIFIAHMLKTMRASVSESGLTGRSHESDIIYAMFDEKLSEEMAGNGGIGLANMLLEQLTERK